MKRLLISTLLVSLAVVGGCKKTEAEGDKGAANKPGGQTASIPVTPNAPPKEDPSLAGYPALERVPASTWMVAAADSASAWDQRLGWAALHAKLKASLVSDKKLRGEEQALFDLFSVTGLAAKGLDPDSRFGVAVWPNEHRLEPTLAAFAGIKDRAAVEAFLQDFAVQVRTAFKTEEVAGAKVVFENKTRGPAFLVTDKTLFLVGEHLGYAEAVKMAKMDKAGSLANHQAFKSGLARLQFGKAGSMYMDMSAVFEQMVLGNSMWRYAMDDHEMEEKELIAKARASEEFKKGTAMMAKLLGKDPWIAMGFDAELNTKSVMNLTPDSLYYKMFKNAKGLHPLFKAVDSVPVYGMASHVEPKALLDGFRSLLAMEGVSEAEVNAMMAGAAIVGLDPTNPEKSFTGEVGFAVTYSGDWKLNLDNAKSFLGGYGGTMLVGMTDAKSFVAALDKLSKSVGDLEDILTSVDGGFDIAVPDFKTLHVRAVGSYLVASTDKATLTAIEKGTDRSFASSIENKAAKKMFDPAPSAATMSFDLRMFAMFVQGLVTVRMSEPPMPVAPMAEGPEAQKRQKELADARKELERLRKAEQAEQVKAFELIMAGLGQMYARVELAPDGWVGYSAMVHPKGLKGLMSGLFDGVMMMEDGPARKAVWKQQEKIWRLTDQMHGAKAEAIDAAAAKADAEAQQLLKDAAKAQEGREAIKTVPVPEVDKKAVAPGAEASPRIKRVKRDASNKAEVVPPKSAPTQAVPLPTP